MFDANDWVMVKGGGDLGTGAAWRLFHAGFPVVVTELTEPLVIRRTVAFASAAWEGHYTVEGVTARRVEFPEAARLAQRAGEVPVLLEPKAPGPNWEGWAARLRPRVLVDATLAKHDTGTRIKDAPLVIGLGPGFEAQVNCHAAVETQRGHTLGRVYWEGKTMEDTGVPGNVMGYDRERVLRAPAKGTLYGCREIGDTLQYGDVVASVSGRLIVAPFPGVLRGLIRDGTRVEEGLKVGDVDPRGLREHCFTISDKARALGGAVAFAILWAAARKKG